MIIYITLAYGLLVTAGAVGIYLKGRGDYDWALTGWRRACELHRIWRRECLEQRDDARAQLSAIKSKRHLAAKKARAAQIAQRKAQVLAKAAELQPQVERIAA